MYARHKVAVTAFALYGAEVPVAATAVVLTGGWQLRIQKSLMGCEDSPLPYGKHHGDPKEILFVWALWRWSFGGLVSIGGERCPGSSSWLHPEQEEGR